MADKKKIKTKKSKDKRIIGPKVSHTKGYYRFSKEFPSVTDSEGFRDNNTFVNSRAKKAAVRRRLALLFVCVFAVSFCVTALCFAISDVPVAEEKKENQTVADVPQVKSVDKIITYGGAVPADVNIESIVGECKTAGADTVIIELKDAQGHFYFKPSISVSAEAQATVVENIAQIIKELKQQGLSVYASVSCFADDIYARNNQSVTAYVTAADESTSIWYGGENGSNAWLSPFSNEVCYYLTTVIGDVAALGVDGIVFENATVPANAESENVSFSLSQGFEISAQQKIADWLSYTVSTVSCKTAITLSSQQLIADTHSDTVPAYYTAGCDFVILDARPSDADKGVAISSLQYLEPGRTPKEYVSALLGLGFEFFGKNSIKMQIVPVIDNTNLPELQLSAAEEYEIYTVVLK
ncbi:MAG: hypothetical protein IJZ35_05120 [Clostridia bacterium]|nr:hypothetical protein [Clostridia bacterium]